MDTNSELADLALRLRRRRVPLAVVVVANTCLLVIAPAWRERTTAAVPVRPLDGVRAKLNTSSASQSPPIPSAIQNTAPAPIAVASVPPEEELPEDSLSPEARERFFEELIGGAQEDPAEANDAPPSEPSAPTQTEEPPQPVIASAEPEAPATVPGLPTIVNPVENRIAVGYLADGQTHWLHPGERHELTSSGPHEILYHRGGEFGDARTVLDEGLHRFVATPTGWQLEPVITP